MLADHKIPLAVGTGFEGYVPKTRVLRYEAAMAMVNGLGRERALAAVTLDAARILGVDDRVGSIEPGKVADLVLYDGDPFEHTSHVTYTIQDGRIVWDREEYLKLPFARRALPLTTGAGWDAAWGSGERIFGSVSVWRAGGVGDRSPLLSLKLFSGAYGPRFAKRRRYSILKRC